MNVSEYIAEFFVKKGIKDIFLIDGAACASMIVGVAKNKNLNYYCPHHEQAGAFAIDGYVKASGSPSVMIATSGPAGQNLINGIAASWYDSVPAIYLTGNINSRFMKPSNEIRQHGFQENDIVSMVSTVTKYAAVVMRAEHIEYELEKAYQLAVSGRPGPVLLDIPMDVQKMELGSGKLLTYNENYKMVPVKENLQGYAVKLKEMIKKSERPVFLLGGGITISKANNVVKKLIKDLKIPYFVTWNMIDFDAYNNPYFGGKVGTYGGEGRNFGIQNCDLLIGLGTRISGRITGGMMDTFARGAKKVLIDIDQEDMKWQQIKADMNIVSNLSDFVPILNDVCSELELDYSDWVKKVLVWKEKYGVMCDEYYDSENVNPYVFMKILCEKMSEGDVLVHEAGGNAVITSQSFKGKKNQKVFSNHGNSSLGYALPAAVGAAIATKKPVLCITGDGGLNFNIQEFQTIKHYKLPVKVLIFNNYAYGITKSYRDTNFDSEYAGCDADHGLESPNFIDVAISYGLKTVKINNHKELELKLDEVINSKEAIVCDIDMNGFYDYLPKIGWKNPIEDMYPFLDRDEFRSNMIIPPLEGWEKPEL
ncbi:thiamine pyrophosphate-binding protein [Candidatus Woesearchaeota archaeon]|nr:thiamine pyrophosphate-binding protein [Candidatus Woesearchaeota archaeon]